VINFHFNFRIW